MTDPALEAEAARLERLLYTRLDGAERARIEAELVAVRGRLETDVAAEVGDTPAVEAAETRTRNVPLLIAAVAVTALVVGGVVGGVVGAALTPRVVTNGPSDGLRLIPQSPAAASAIAGQPAMLSVFTRKQVIAADDSSDIPAVNVGSAYSTDTFRHLGQLELPRSDDTIVGNVYAVLRKTDFAVCLVVTSRVEFVADTCIPSSEIGAPGVTLSSRIRSTLYSIAWQTDGSLEIASNDL